MSAALKAIHKRFAFIAFRSMPTYLSRTGSALMCSFGATFLSTPTSFEEHATYMVACGMKTAIDAKSL